MRLVFLLLMAAVAALQPGNLHLPNTSLPTIVHQVGPKYTKEGTEAKLQGAAILAATIRIDGTPSEIKVFQGLGKGLDEKAVECFQQWRFKPGARDGKPGPMRVLLEIDFCLPKIRGFAGRSARCRRPLIPTLPGN
jgi:TonB family protein